MHPFEAYLLLGGKSYTYYSLPALKDPRVARLPFCVRVLLESALRDARKKDIDTILDWEKTSRLDQEVLFLPSRVILQDFTGVPAVVDLAAMRDAVKQLGGDASRINPRVPVDLVIDHSVQVDAFRSADALQRNLELEFHRNRERFQFLKWGANAFSGLSIVPPGAGIVHQVNLEFIARTVFNVNDVLYPDSLVGTDSHTPMINGLGIVGWGVGGIEAEAVMLGQPIAMVLPEVVGVKLTGSLSPLATATDLVLAIVRMLRQVGVVEKFVEFYGPGVAQLSIADRATISNMSPEMGATIGFFPADQKAIDYLHLTGRSDEQIDIIEAYLKAQGLFRDYSDASTDPVYSHAVELDLATIVPSIAGPKRPHDFIPLRGAKQDFEKTLSTKVGFKGFDIAAERRGDRVAFTYEGKQHELSHGAVVIAAITSCTNTSNPHVMVAAGLLAQKAVERGLSVERWVKTSLAPGSGVVTAYLTQAGLLPYLERLGFGVVGYGCTTCIGNSGPLPDEVAAAIEQGDLVCCGVLSGNRNFEGRIHPHVRANFLASPPLVVAYALAGTMLTDFESDALGVGADGKPVFLADIWPSHEEVDAVIKSSVLPRFFTDVYSSVTKGTAEWNSLVANNDALYQWDSSSTYIHSPPFFAGMRADPQPETVIRSAYCLVNLGDSITTDHISPAGSISVKSPAARYLMARGVDRKDFNSYGARRGNDEVMARGTFANTRIVNKFLGKAAPQTIHQPSGDVLDIWDAAERYIRDGQPLIILAGEQYGSGSSRDWAAKGVWMQGVKAVIAKSYERIHRSNLVLFGLIPLEFKRGEDADSLGLSGKERFSIDLSAGVQPGMDVKVVAVDEASGKTTEFLVTLRFDTQTEITYFHHGGVLSYVIRQSLASVA